MNADHLEIIETIEKIPSLTREPTIKNAVTKFSKQKIEMEQAPFFFPPGYETIFLSIYVVSLPYIMGILFLFFYISHANFELFSVINRKSSFLFTWAIGYEILAAMFFIFIIKLFIDSVRAEHSRNQLQQKFRRP